MNYLDMLKIKAEECGNILCMGIDPVIDKIPIKDEPGKAILKFYLDILAAMQSEGIKIPTVKPNIAFFEQYGPKGLSALKGIIEEYQKAGIDVILDAKRGDIGSTSKAYAKAVFDYWNADAVTLHPYLGYDSISPFLDFKDKGNYVLARTSNKSAVEIQDLLAGEKPVYRIVSELILKWHSPGIGAVIGATYPKELAELSALFVKSGKQVPLLIPGVGSQGGSAKEVMDVLTKTNNPLWLHRINSSSGISYAYLKENTDDYAGAAVKELKKLINTMKI
ncbi:MAG: orotidine-5'-phosphate decarboxylase [archaeon]